MKIRSAGAELFHADKRTDRYDNANSRFSQFCESALKTQKHIYSNLLHRSTITEPQNNTDDDRTDTVLRDLSFSKQRC